jgi:dihydrofolate reductase
MAKTLIDLSMSLDGFITGPNPTSENGFGGRGAEKLHDWYFNGETPSPHNDFFKPLGPSAEVVEEMFATSGAMVIGRTFYDIVNGWGGNHPVRGVPIFVVTHHPPAPEKVPQGATPFTFVTDGIESAIKQAKAAAGDKYIGIAGANIAQQALKAGLIDEIYIHLVPILLGDGIRLFDQLGPNPLELEQIKVIEAPGVTHMRYRVVK